MNKNIFFIDGGKINNHLWSGVGTDESGELIFQITRNNIEWQIEAELLSLLGLVNHIINNKIKGKILVKTDNQMVGFEYFNSKTNAGEYRLEAKVLSIQYKLEIEFEYISSVDNLADQYSRIKTELMDLEPENQINNEVYSKILNKETKIEMEQKQEKSLEKKQYTFNKYIDALKQRDYQKAKTLKTTIYFQKGDWQLANQLWKQNKLKDPTKTKEYKQKETEQKKLWEAQNKKEKDLKKKIWLEKLNLKRGITKNTPKIPKIDKVFSKFKEAVKQKDFHKAKKLKTKLFFMKFDMKKADEIWNE